MVFYGDSCLYAHRSNNDGSRCVTALKKGRPSPEDVAYH